jgi:putative ABC transport system permease protein
MLAGLLVLMSALNSTRSDREREMALLRALGASGAQAMQSQLGELLLMGLLVGLFASLLAQLTGWGVARSGSIWRRSGRRRCGASGCWRSRC